jgi:hypothetical protein
MHHFCFGSRGGIRPQAPEAAGVEAAAHLLQRTEGALLEA